MRPFLNEKRRSRMRIGHESLVLALSLLALGSAGAAGAAEPRVQRLAAVEGAALHDWDARI